MHLHLDALAYRNHLRSLPPDHKVGFALLLIGLSYGVTAPFQLGIAVWLLIWIVVYARIPLKIYLKLLIIPLGFWLMSSPAFLVDVTLSVPTASLANIGAGIELGPLFLTFSLQGIQQVSSLLPRMLALTSCLYFMLLTTPFSELLQVLMRWRCPVLLVELLLLMYRFIFVLIEIALRLLTAQQARLGYRTWRIGLRSLGLLVSQLLWQTLENYRRVSLSFASRGFTGTVPVWQTGRHCPSWRYGLEAGAGCLLLALTIGWRYAAAI